MNKSNLFPKVALAGVAVAIAATGIAIEPAQAFVFKNGSSLNWGDATSDFFDDVQEVNGDPLQLTFNPIGSNVFISDATGSFATAFNIGETTPIVNDPIVANLTYFDIAATGNANRYVLQDTIEWDFGERELMPHEGENVTGNLKWVLPVGSEFEVAFDQGNAIEIDLCLDTCVSLPYFEFDGDTFGAPLSDGSPNNTGEVVMGVLQDTRQNTFTFQQSSDADNGSYSASAVVAAQKTTPEPASILGLLAIGGLGLGLKRKKQSKQLSV